MVRSSIQQLGREARQIRREHGAGAHLPEGLRKAAVQLSSSQRTEAIIRELEISGETLRRWKERYPAAMSATTRSSLPRQAATKPEPIRPAARINRIDVVEIKASGPSPVGCAGGVTSAIEVIRPDGWTMRMTGDLAKDLAATMVGKFKL